MGTVRESIAIFGPNLFETIPKTEFPTTPPMQIIEAIQDSSSVEILPDGNGVSSDFKSKREGLAQPEVTFSRKKFFFFNSNYLNFRFL